MTNREVEECKAEISSLEGMLNDRRPHIQAQIEDRGAMSNAARSLANRLDAYAPPETNPAQRDAVAKRERELLEKIMEGMPSKAEMRKCPPGAIGKHREWEKRNKSRIIEWKNLRRILNLGNEDPDISNVEMFRPTASTLNMENAVIPGKDYFLPSQHPNWDQNYDRTFNGGEASTEDVQALKDRLAALEAQLASQPVARARPTQEPETAACGKVCRNHTGRVSHERHHKCNEPVVNEADPVV
jgi:hypothetical protein